MWQANVVTPLWRPNKRGFAEVNPGGVPWRRRSPTFGEFNGPASQPRAIQTSFLCCFCCVWSIIMKCLIPFWTVANAVRSGEEEVVPGLPELACHGSRRPTSPARIKFCRIFEIPGSFWAVYKVPNHCRITRPGVPANFSLPLGNRVASLLPYSHVVKTRQ